jgi:hypothetical protein
MFADLPLALQVALDMIAVFDGLLVLALLLSLPYLGYITWLTRHGQRVEGTITDVTQEKQATKRGPKFDCYEVTWTDPRTQQARHAILKYPTAMAPGVRKGQTVPVYVHPTLTRLRTVRLQEDSWQLGQAWREGELRSYLAEMLFSAMWWGVVVAALCVIPALANFLQNSQNWQLGLGMVLGGYLIGFLTTCLMGLIIRR